jgi:hypothetical protein
LIEPFEGAGAALATNENVNLEFLRVHRGMIAPGGERLGQRAACQFPVTRLARH